MSRDLNADLITQITSPAYRPFFAIKAVLDSTTLSLWTGIGDISISGTTYSGVGTFLDISDIEETAQISAKGLALTLSGVPSDLLSLALTEQYQGRLLTLLFGVTDLQRVFLLRQSGDFILLQDGGKVILNTDDVPAELFKGYIDQMVIDEGSETSKISVAVESKLIDLERGRIFRYSNQSQKATFPNDKGLEFVDSLQDKKFNWGRE